MLDPHHPKAVAPPPEARTLAAYEASAPALSACYEHADRARMQRVMGSLIAPGGKVLEIGCGSGADAASLHAMNIDVVALDGSASMLAEAARLHPEIAHKLVHLELPTRLPFEDEAVDVVIASTVLMHFSPEKLEQVTKELARVIRPGGFFYLTVIPERSDLNQEGFDSAGRFFNRLDMRALATIFERHLLYPEYWREVPDALGRQTVRIEEGVFRKSASSLSMPTSVDVSWRQALPTGVLPRMAQEFPSLENEILEPSLLDRIIDREAITPTLDALLLPTLGCFTPGYSLVVPSRPLFSCAELTPEEIRALSAPLHEWREILGAVFGETIVAEHGSSASCTQTAACVSQAHLHLIPMPGHTENLLDRYCEAGGRADEEIPSLDELSKVVRDDPYILFSSDPRTYLVWFNVSDFPRQFVRRHCADLLGIGGLYNWRVFPFVEQMELTSTLLRPLFLRISSCKARASSPAIRWETPYDNPDLIDPFSDPHVALFGEQDVERLLFFAACCADGIAEESLDQLGRLVDLGQINSEELPRLRSAAHRALRTRFSATTAGAGLRLLDVLGTPPEDLAKIRGELLDAFKGDDDD